MRAYACTAVAAAGLLALGGMGGATAQGIAPGGTGAGQGFFFGSGRTTSGGYAASGFWQGSWGIEGKSPLVTIAGSDVGYVGIDRQTFTVSNVAIGATTLTFQVGSALVSLTRRTDDNVEMISAIGENASDPILLCRSAAAHCP